MRRYLNTYSVGIALAAILFSTIYPTILLASIKVEVPLGTPIELAFESTIHPSTATIGQKVYLLVTRDVEVDDHIVIKEGARAIGEVTQSTIKGNVGKPAVIGITLRNVEAVDGTQIPISGTKVIQGEDKQSNALIITILCCVLGLLMKGGDAEITQGTLIDATVANNVDVELNIDTSNDAENDIEE